MKLCDTALLTWLFKQIHKDKGPRALWLTLLDLTHHYKYVFPIWHLRIKTARGVL